MASDVATLIYKRARDDRELDRCELKEAFQKKIRMDQQETRNQLMELIRSRIKTHRQPQNAFLELSEEVVRGGTGLFLVYKSSNKVQVSDPKLLYTQDGYSFLAKNASSIALIRDVILPLDLHWNPKMTHLLVGEHAYNIVVSWAHWAHSSPVALRATGEE